MNQLKNIKSYRKYTRVKTTSGIQMTKVWKTITTTVVLKFEYAHD